MPFSGFLRHRHKPWLLAKVSPWKFLFQIAQKVILPNAKHILIITKHQPPDLPTAWFDTYNDQSNRLLTENKETMICGDLICVLLQNIHQSANHTKHFIYSCEIHQLTQLTDRLKRITLNDKTLIVVILTTNHENISTQENLHTRLVDNQLVYCVTWSHTKPRDTS